MALARGWNDFVAEWLAISGRSTSFDRLPLAGDASNREYFRVRFGDGASPSSAILMQRNVGEGFRKSEEAVSGKGEGPPGDPFILVARFLKGKGLPSPLLYHFRTDGSLILQEDLGDQTLLSHLDSHPEEEETLTGEVLRLLVSLQGLPWHSEMPWLSERRFGVGLVRWEFEHFLEFGLDPGLPSSHPGAFSGIREEIERESAFLADWGSGVPVHRDYHSRNLMVRENGTLGLIDFQDLLLGSPFYDLASFLFDAYRTVPMEQIEKWVLFYRREAQKAGILPETLTPEDCFSALARHAFQRNLKACGRFFYIADVKQNPSFLPSVAGTHRNLARLAERVPGLRSFFGKIRPFLRSPS